MINFLIVHVHTLKAPFFFLIISRRAADVDGECSLPYLIVNAGWHAASPEIS